MASVLRARLTEHLLESGVQNDLRREVYLCGLFSRLDELLNMRHPLIRLAALIDWAEIERNFSMSFTSGRGRPALRARQEPGLERGRVALEERAVPVAQEAQGPRRLWAHWAKVQGP